MNDRPVNASNRTEIAFRIQGDVMKSILAVTLCIGTFAAQPAFSDEAHHKKPQEVVVAQAVAMTEAEVRKVDKVAKKITLKHGPIPSLDMPGMTMVFQVADPAMLDQVKAGDKVRFTADKIGGGYAVTKIEPQK
jgi:Cu(I)/Ag(I) efflux system protein CusF